MISYFFINSCVFRIFILNFISLASNYLLKTKAYENKSFIYGVCLFVCLFVYGCNHYDLINVSEQTNESAKRDSLIRGAQDFFEGTLTKSSSTKINIDSVLIIPTGEYTPLWDDAIILENQLIHSIDVEINSKNKYKATIHKQEESNIVDVTQKLVVIKRKKDNVYMSYVLTLIPDHTYYKKNKGSLAKKFVHFGKKNNFSGLAIFSSASRGYTVQVSRYVKGEITDIVSFPKKIEKEMVDKANQIIGTITAHRIADITTRGGAITPGGLHCSFCGNLVESCSCGVIVDYCECGNCYLCWSRQCSHCGDMQCSCTNQIIDETDFIEPGGGSGGGGSSGGNGQTDEDEEEEEEEEEDNNQANTPCKDTINGISNPLTEMSLASPSPNNPAGALFGNNVRRDRNGNAKSHRGVDFHAEVGTPIYATHNGIISNNAPFITYQPNRIDQEDYPENYTGIDINDAGNRIHIDIGDGVIIAYWHLQAGNAVARDKRGKLLAPGDSVKMGQIIAYVGITGNASADVPHLHISVYRNGVLVDPFNYINATLNPVTFEVSTPCD